MPGCVVTSILFILLHVPLTLSSQCPSLPDSAALYQQAGPPRVKPSGPCHDEADRQPGGSRSQAAGWAWGGDTGGDALQKPRRVNLTGTARTRMRMRTRRMKRRRRRQVSCPPRSCSDAGSQEEETKHRLAPSE